MSSNPLRESTTRISLAAGVDFHSNQETNNLLTQVAQIKNSDLTSFKASDITPDIWMLPVLPRAIKNCKKEDFTEHQKLMAFRYSYQYILLKQKLMM